MEISKLYEKAVEKLEKAVDVCAKSEINLSSLTLVCTNKGNVYTGINWRTINDSFEEEMTCSEREAISKMLFAGETVIESIVTLDPVTKAPINPCQKCLELIISVDLANTACKVLSGKNSHVTITSINSDIAKYAEKLFAQYHAEQAEKIDAVINEVNDGKTAQAINTTETAVPAAENPFTENIPTENPFEGSAPAESGAPVSDQSAGNTNPAENAPSENTENANTENANNENSEKPIDGNEEAAENGEPQGSAAHTGIDTTGLKMIFDDWESTSESQAPEETKPFNASSLSTNQQEIINTVQNMSEDMYNQQGNLNPTPPAFGQQPMNNGMYQQQPMNGMYQQQPMNGMYQQQPMNNGMYQQQPMNNGMYQQQPMNNGMYQQQPMNNGMYQQQPMNGMYQQQPMNNGMYQQQPMNNGMYQQQQPMNNGMYQQQPMNNGMYQQQASTNSLYMNQMPRGQQNSVYLNQPNQSQQNSNNSSVYLNRMQAPISTGTQRPASATQSMSVYGKNSNGDNNAIFKDRLNDILNSGGQSKTKATSMAMEDVMQSAKDKKKAAKKNKK